MTTLLTQFSRRSGNIMTPRRSTSPDWTLHFVQLALQLSNHLSHRTCEAPGIWLVGGPDSSALHLTSLLLTLHTAAPMDSSICGMVMPEVRTIWTKSRQQFILFIYHGIVDAALPAMRLRCDPEPSWIRQAILAWGVAKNLWLMTCKCSLQSSNLFWHHCLSHEGVHPANAK